ncbi:MAG: flippase-like domain-containing protein [Myxococcales bacterium FL481]|nr:MAG: flippase-like domain-containing protein [Myxococcales bacterium FL481]
MHSRVFAVALSTGLGLAALAAAWHLVPPFPSRLHPCGSALAVYAGIVATYHVVRAWRWHVLVRPNDHAPATSHLTIAWIGFAWIALLPMRLGEFVRPALLARRRQVSFVAATGSILVERLVDAAIISGLFLILAGTALADHGRRPEIGTLVRGSALIAATLFVVSVGLVVAALARGRVETWAFDPLAPRLPRLVARLRTVVEELARGLSVLTDPGTRRRFVAATGAYWALNAAGMWQLATAHGLDLPYAQSLTLIAVLGLTLLLPAAPAQAGPFQLGLALGLQLAANPAPPDEIASSYLASCYAVQLGVIVAFGAASHVWLGLGWRSVLGAREASRQPHADPGPQPRASQRRPPQG